jgi:hypothetical protein
MHIEQVQAQHLYISSAYDKEPNPTARHLLYAKLPSSPFTTPFNASRAPPTQKNEAVQEGAHFSDNFNRNVTLNWKYNRLSESAFENPMSHIRQCISEGHRPRPVL